MLRKVTSSIVLALVVLAFTAGVASAQNATQDAYGGLLGQQTTSGQQGASLPFTGFDVAIVALIGVALVGTGLVVRRTVRSNQS